MNSSERQDLGAGAYGWCCKVREPHSGEELVILTFVRRALKSLVVEATIIHRLQAPGKQPLGGVCVRRRQDVGHYAEMILGRHWRTVTLLTDAANFI